MENEQWKNVGKKTIPKNIKVMPQSNVLKTGPDWLLDWLKKALARGLHGLVEVNQFGPSS